MRSSRRSSLRAGASRSSRPSISGCSSRRAARSRTCSSRPAIRRPRSSRSTCTTATCSRSAPPTTSLPRTSSTWPRRAPLPGLDLQALRAGRRASPRRRSEPRLLPSGYVSFPEDDPVCPQPGGWSPGNAESGLGLPEPRDRDDPLRQRRLRAVDARPRAGAGGGDRAPARHPLEAAAALRDGARRRRRHPARADERLRDDRGRRDLPPAARDPARAERRTGKLVADNAFKVHSKRVVSPAIASRRPHPRAGDVRVGHGTNARLDDGRPEAGKTGTAENFGNAWFCGYTPESRPACGSAIAGRTSRSRASRAWAPCTAARSPRHLEGLHDDRHASPVAA